MGSFGDKRQQLREASPGQAARLIYRKAIHRKVLFGRWGMQTGLAMPPRQPLELRIDLVGPDQFDRALEDNPHLLQSDLEHFREQETTCILVLDGDRVASSSWMTRGEVFFHELQRSITVPKGEHFSCRSFVHPDYRGRALFSHLVYTYSMSVPPEDEVWGLVLPENIASVRSLENIGWRRSGDYWTHWVLGRKVAGERRYPPLPPFEPAG